MGAKILVIDDSMMVRKQVGSALLQAGFAVYEAIDGIDALEKLAATADTALIVCDVNMPRMSGLEFLESLRKDGGAAASVPVVMLTTEGQPELVQKAKALGAKGWIIKPFKAELLVSAVKKLTA